jgi:putative ABC transport system permease protein
MKAILRNLLSVARRFKLAATLNILGLSVAFATFMVIMVQLDYDYGFDKFHQDSDKIFRMESMMPDGTAAIVSRPIAEVFFESSPYIVAGGLAFHMAAGSDYFQVEVEGQRNSYREKSIQVTPGFTEVFTFDFVEGAPDALKTPDNVIIPLSMARRLFGRESAVGRQIVYPSNNKNVGAVYRDFPGNTIVENIIYSQLPEDAGKQNWGSFDYGVYIRVNQASNASMLVDDFMQNFDFREVLPAEMLPFWDQMGINFRLTPLTDIHFTADVQYDPTPKTSRQMLMILLAIAIVIVAIAAINFTNFSTALTPMRVKSINTQRVLGARRSTLR